MKSAYQPVIGDDMLSIWRFYDDTRHMIEFQMLTDEYIEPRGAYVRVFVSEDGYAEALELQRRGTIRIYSHSNVIEGHIMPDKKKKRKRGRKNV